MKELTLGGTVSWCAISVLFALLHICISLALPLSNNRVRRLEHYLLFRFEWYQNEISNTIVFWVVFGVMVGQVELEFKGLLKTEYFYFILIYGNRVTNIVDVKLQLYHKAVNMFN